MTKQTKYSPEVRERAVRMVLTHQNEHPSQWTAICSIAAKIRRDLAWLNAIKASVRG